MPIEDEGRLTDPDLRESFINRVYAYQKWRNLQKKGIKSGDLVAFHTDYKLLLMARDPLATRQLGRLIANSGSSGDTASEYIQLFMKTMKKKAIPKRQANVLYRLLNILGDRITAPDRREITQYIEAYRKSVVPISAPLILMNHHFKNHPQTWSAVPKYLAPYPFGFETGFAMPV